MVGQKTLSRLFWVSFLGFWGLPLLLFLFLLSWQRVPLAVSFSLDSSVLLVALGTFVGVVLCCSVVGLGALLILIRRAVKRTGKSAMALLLQRYGKRFVRRRILFLLAIVILVLIARPLVDMLQLQSNVWNVLALFLWILLALGFFLLLQPVLSTSSRALEGGGKVQGMEALNLR